MLPPRSGRAVSVRRRSGQPLAAGGHRNRGRCPLALIDQECGRGLVDGITRRLARKAAPPVSVVARAISHSQRQARAGGPGFRGLSVVRCTCQSFLDPPGPISGVQGVAPQEAHHAAPRPCARIIAPAATTAGEAMTGDKCPKRSQARPGKREAIPPSGPRPTGPVCRGRRLGFILPGVECMRV